MRVASQHRDKAETKGPGGRCAALQGALFEFLSDPFGNAPKDSVKFCVNVNARSLAQMVLKSRLTLSRSALSSSLPGRRKRVPRLRRLETCKEPELMSVFSVGSGNGRLTSWGTSLIRQPNIYADMDPLKATRLALLDELQTIQSHLDKIADKNGPLYIKGLVRAVLTSIPMCVCPEKCAVYNRILEACLLPQSVCLEIIMGYVLIPRSLRAAPAPDRFSSRISEYFRERIIPGAPALKAAFTAFRTSEGCVFFCPFPVGMSTSIPG